MSEFVAALPMYDWPETRAETEAEWARLRDAFRGQGIDAPERLTRRNGDLPPMPGGIRDAEGKIIAPDPATLPPDEFDLHTLWLHPGLLFAQTCWGPMELGLARHVRVVGQPSYDGFEGGQGEFYSSAILMRRGDGVVEGIRSTVPPSVLPDISPSRGEIGSGVDAAKPGMSIAGGDMDEGLISPPEGEMSGRTEGGNVGHERFPGSVPAPKDGCASLPLDLLHSKRLAYNSLDSMSGIIALSRDLDAMGESLDIFSERIETGAHRSSVIAVAEGRADVCAIDCRTWAMVQRYKPRANDVQVVGWTGRRKGLPYITAAHTPDTVAAKLRAALASL